MKRRLLSLILAFTLLLALAAPAMAEDAYRPFSDVGPDDYFYEPVIWAVGGTITNGFPDGTFRPNNTCTRGQVVTFLWRAMGEPEPSTLDNPFIDVKGGDYFYTAVLWAVEQGITNGTKADTFSPDITCTCAHILTFLWRAMDKPEAGDISPIAERFPRNWYTDAVSWAEYQQLLSGFEDNFDVTANCSRAMTVTYLFRALVYGQALWGGEWDPVVMQRQILVDENVLCGAVYLGSFAEQRDKNEIINEYTYWYDVLRASGLMEQYEFLRQLPASQIVQSGGGREIYLIIPTDRFASVAVNQWIVDESNGWVGEPGEVLYRSSTGAPFLLCCNWVDSSPDTQVVIVGENGDVLTWYPQLSHMDERMQTVFNNQYVYDFTQYPDESEG